MNQTDVIIIGAGAAGLMCAIEAGKRGRRVVVLEHNSSVGERFASPVADGATLRTSTQIRLVIFHRIRISLSQHSHDIRRQILFHWFKKVHIPYQERKLGQLFCDASAEQLIRMLLEECRKVNVEIRTDCHVKSIHRLDKFSHRN